MSTIEAAAPAAAAPPAPPAPPADRATLLLGGGCAIVGAVGTVVVNLMHPLPPPGTEGLLRVVAATPHWPTIHFGAIYSALFILGGLVGLAHSLTGAASRALGRWGLAVATVGVAVMVVGLTIDGSSSKRLADAWMATGAQDQATMLQAIDAVIAVEMSEFGAWASIGLGLSFVIFGMAVALGRDYPRWAGWVAVAAGAGCFVVGADRFLLAERLVQYFPWFAFVVSAWTAFMGVLMLRRARTAA
jgi:hypothetical protein